MTNQGKENKGGFLKLPAYGIKAEKKEMVFSELNSLLSSGLDFSRSFTLLIESEKDKKTAIILRSLYGNVVKGVQLWRAVELSGKFSALDYGVIRIGEETGRLGESLEFLSTYYRKKAEQKRIVVSAMRYPVIILTIALVVVIFMLAVVVPMFEEVYTRMGGELPAITKWIINVSKLFPLYGTITFLIVSSLSLILYALKDRAEVRAVMSILLMNIPVAGKILMKNNQAHFCKLLHLLTGSGVPLLHGIEMLKSIIVFYPYNNSLSAITSDLIRGGQLSVSLEKFQKLYDKKLITLIRVGEETNTLPAMFKRQGDEITKELEYRLQKTGSIVEPLLVFVVGILVAVILISMYMPMFKLGGIMD